MMDLMPRGGTGIASGKAGMIDMVASGKENGTKGAEVLDCIPGGGKSRCVRKVKDAPVVILFEAQTVCLFTRLPARPGPFTCLPVYLFTLLPV